MVKNDVVKKTEYNKLVTKVDNIDTTNFVKKTKYEKDGSDFEDKIDKIDKKTPDVTSLIKKTDFNPKVTEIIVTRNETVWIHGPFSKNFRNMSTIVGWLFTEGTDLFQRAPSWRWH